MNSFSRVEIERSLFLPAATLPDIEDLCKAAVANSDAAVCVPPLFISKAKEFIGDARVQVSTIVGFPYGFPVIEAKLAEAVLAMVYGADELEIAVNMTALKNNDWQYLAKEINTILPVVRAKGKKVKILVEAKYLTDDELIKCCDLYGIAGIDFLSLSAGVVPAANEQQVALVRAHLADNVDIKVGAHEDAGENVPAGVKRLMIPYSLKIC